MTEESNINATYISSGDASGDKAHIYSRVFLSYLLATAFLCGSLIMVIEVMGSRVVGPFYGVSLFVWTSLITVTLISLSLGYAIGGSLSVNRGHPDWLYSIIFISGITCLVIPVMKAPVLKFFQPLGLRFGSLASSTVLFGPTLLLLGCVSPYLIRILAREIRSVGRTAGALYSISTMGSFIGTLLTGFYFIAYFGIDSIFRFTGGLLIAIAIVYFTVFRHRKWTLLLIILPIVFPAPASITQKTLPKGGVVREVFNQESYYGNIKIVDYDFGLVNTREMMIDGLVQGGIDRRNKMSIYAYSYFLQYLPIHTIPGGRSCLVIGVGAGIVPRFYEQMGIRTDIVDIDPEVVRIAQEYFDFKLSGDVLIEDARYVFNTSQKQWDYVIFDVFSGDTTPSHLLSLEALEAAGSILAPGGILAANIIGSLEGDTYMTASIIKTFKAVFDQVDVYPLFNPEEGKSFGNMILLAYNGQPRVPHWDRIRSLPVHLMARQQVQGVLGRPAREPSDPDAIILTDNYNPVDFFDSWVKESVRKQIHKDTDWDILTGS